MWETSVEVEGFIIMQQWILSTINLDSQLAIQFERNTSKITWGNLPSSPSNPNSNWQLKRNPSKPSMQPCVTFVQPITHLAHNSCYPSCLIYCWLGKRLSFLLENPPSLWKLKLPPLQLNQTAFLRHYASPALIPRENNSNSSLTSLKLENLPLDHCLCPSLPCVISPLKIWCWLARST